MLMQYEVINIYGDNIVGTEGPNWKRHRAVAKPAFNEVSPLFLFSSSIDLYTVQANNAFVWSETIRVISEWFYQIDASQEKQQKVPTVDLVADLTQVSPLITFIPRN